jgi:hypothetical protein
MVVVVALEIRDLVGAAWNAFRASQVERSHPRHTPKAPRPQLPTILAQEGPRTSLPKAA